MNTRILDIIRSSKGRMFTVTFYTKSGTLRILNGRLGVTYPLTGKGMKYNPIERGLLPVFDVQAKGYRMITLDNVKSIKINGKEYIIL